MLSTIKIPGLIDVHTHLREPGSTQKEDFETGTKAAVAGGYTAILDMPNNTTPTTTPEALDKKIKLATKRIYCDLGFNFGASKDSIKYFESIKNKVFGLKIYMNQTTGPLFIEENNDLESIFEAWPDEKIIMVHAEGETLQKAISLASKFKKKLHVCHVSLASEIEMIKHEKEKGGDITCEVTPHHLFLTSDLLSKLGSFGLVKPPLSSDSDVKSLWENLDYIDMIASDHAPHTKEEKEGNKPPFGVPGLETTLPLMLTAVNDELLSLEKLIDMTSAKPRKRFNIPEQKDTFVEIDQFMKWEIGESGFFTKSNWSPFKGMRVKGKVIKTVLRGSEVYADEVINNPPSGQIIYPCI